MNDKQKLILKEISDERPVTQIINGISKELDCSKSVLWYNLKHLVNLELVNYEKRTQCKLTRAGMMILNELSRMSNKNIWE